MHAKGQKLAGPPGGAPLLQERRPKKHKQPAAPVMPAASLPMPPRLPQNPAPLAPGPANGYWNWRTKLLAGGLAVSAAAYAAYRYYYQAAELPCFVPEVGNVTPPVPASGFSPLVGNITTNLTAMAGAALTPIAQKVVDYFSHPAWPIPTGINEQEWMLTTLRAHSIAMNLFLERIKWLKSIVAQNTTAIQESIKRSPWLINTFDDDGMSSLMIATRYNLKSIITLLINAGAKLNIQDLKKGYTALMYAIQFGHPEIARDLILAGADVNLRASDGMDALSLLKQTCAAKAGAWCQDIMLQLLARQRPNQP